nr:hypothetical protein [Microbacterium endophyticum]
MLAVIVLDRPWQMPVLYGVLGFVAVAAYGLDKSAARPPALDIGADAAHARPIRSLARRADRKAAVPTQAPQTLVPPCVPGARLRSTLRRLTA